MLLPHALRHHDQVEQRGRGKLGRVGEVGQGAADGVVEGFSGGEVGVRARGLDGQHVGVSARGGAFPTDRRREEGPVQPCARGVRECVAARDQRGQEEGYQPVTHVVKAGQHADAAQIERQQRGQAHEAVDDIAADVFAQEQGAMHGDGCAQGAEADKEQGVAGELAPGVAQQDVQGDVARPEQEEERSYREQPDFHTADLRTDRVLVRCA